MPAQFGSHLGRLCLASGLRLSWIKRSWQAIWNTTRPLFDLSLPNQKTRSRTDWCFEIPSLGLHWLFWCHTSWLSEGCFAWFKHFSEWVEVRRNQLAASDQASQTTLLPCGLLFQSSRGCSSSKLSSAPSFETSKPRFACTWCLLCYLSAHQTIPLTELPSQ